MSHATIDTSPSGGTHAGAGGGHRGKALGVAIAAAVGGFLFGFDSSVINGAVESITGRFHLGSFMSGFVVSIALLGCAVGAWFAGRISDRYGRKATMVAGAVLFLASSIGTAFSYDLATLLIFRVIGGLGIGIASVIAPAYISEIAPAKERGALGSLQQLAITIGQLVVLSSNALFAHWAGGPANDLWWGIPAWRWMFLVGVIPAAIYGTLALLIPESPRYLVARGKTDKAERVLAGTTGEPDPRRTVREIERTISAEHQPSFADIRGNRFGLNPLVWVGIIMAALQQLIGINAIFYYSTTLWQSVGFSSGSSYVTSVITATVNVVMTIVTMLFIDRLGRRRMLLGGSIGMFVGLAMMTVAFSQQIGSGNDISLPGSWGPVALVGANVFVMFFALSWGPILWVMLAEMFPNRMRGYALAIGTAANWIFNFIVTLCFEPLTKSVGLSWLYGAFAFFAVVAFFFTKYKVPETNGRELESMTA